MITTYAETVDSEVYIYVRGQLVMKRWTNTGESALFHVAPAAVVWNRNEGRARK